MRSKRWIWALAGWFVLIGAVTGLIIWAAHEIYNWDNNGLQAGPMAFGVITFFVLGMGLLIAPTFSATSINGDRAGGTLATLQATKLSALEIASGKLLAAWLTAAVFLVVALPFIVWSMVLGNISVLQVLVVFSVVLIEVAVVCAIGLGWSALISRPAGSAVMTYLSIAFLTIISTMVMLLLTPMVVEEEPVRIWGLHGQVLDEYESATERYWNANPTETARACQPRRSAMRMVRRRPHGHPYRSGLVDHRGQPVRDRGGRGPAATGRGQEPQSI